MSKITGIASALPEKILTNAELKEAHPDWRIDTVERLMGFKNRRIAGPDQFSSDLAIQAGKNLFAETDTTAEEYDFLIVCTQTPDFFLSTTAALVANGLGLRKVSGAVDLTLGCSGYPYALSMAKGLLESEQANRVLVITTDVLSKITNNSDKSTIPVFGDAASATSIERSLGPSGIRGVVFGTDGDRAGKLIVPNGGLRSAHEVSPSSSPISRGLLSTGYDLYMDGSAVFDFTLEVVPETIQRVLKASGLAMSEIDLVVFHQANRFILDHLREKLNLPVGKVFINVEEIGNTSSSSIPIALKDAETEGVLRPGMTVMVVGFGVGLSWAGAIIDWR